MPVSKIELYQKCPYCGGTGWTQLIPQGPSELCPKCTRGFVLIYPHIVIRVEEGRAELGAITPAGVDITVDIIDIDDGGVLETTPEDDLRQIINEYWGNDWEKFAWRWTFVDDLLLIENMEVDGTPLTDFVDGELSVESISHDFYDEIDYHSLMNRNITEVHRVEDHS